MDNLHDTSVDAPSEPTSQPLLPNRWHTISRHGEDIHVRLDENGRINAGPTTLRGQRLGGIPRSFGRITIHPEGEKPTGVHEQHQFESGLGFAHSVDATGVKRLINRYVDNKLAHESVMRHTTPGRGWAGAGLKLATAFRNREISAPSNEHIQAQMRYNYNPDRFNDALEAARSRYNTPEDYHFLKIGDGDDHFMARVTPQGIIDRGPKEMHGVHEDQIPQTGYKSTPVVQQEEDLSNDRYWFHPRDASFPDGDEVADDPVNYYKQLLNGPTPVDQGDVAQRLAHAFDTNRSANMGHDEHRQLLRQIQSGIDNGVVPAWDASVLRSEMRRAGMSAFDANQHFALLRDKQSKDSARYAAARHATEQYALTSAKRFGIQLHADRDSHSAALFTGKFRELDIPQGQHAEIMRSLGRIFKFNVDPQTLAHYTGAPHGSHVSFELEPFEYYHPAVRMQVENNDLGFRTSRAFVRDDENKLICHNEEMIFDPTKQSQGVGSRVFAQQVKHQRLLGVHTIICEAARREGEFIGYKVWPKMGYDAPVPTYFYSLANIDPRGVDTILDLYSQPHLREAWERDGHSLSMFFLLHPESRNSLWHANYCRKKGIIV